MKLAIDVHFGHEGAHAAALVFEAWDAPEAERTLVTRSAVAQGMKKPARGEPDLRALPCILQLLREHALAPELILLQGSVHLDAQQTPGLGQHLFEALGGQMAVVGISSKTALPGLPAQFELYREEGEDADDAARPLIVTCAGIDLGAAKARVRGMHGKRRLPTLVKRVARLAKQAATG